MNITATPDGGDLQRCREIISSVDSMCQTQVGQINALVSTTLRAMETPQFWEHPLALREMLGLVQYLVVDLGNFVNVSAENIGCNFVDPIDRAREKCVLDAFRQTRPRETSHV